MFEGSLLSRAVVPLALALLAGPLSASGGQTDGRAGGQTAAKAAETCISIMDEEAAAKRMAKRCDHRVEVMSQRTETTLVYANPNGTMTAEAALKPQRIHRADGSWTPTDATLRRAADGSVVPVASFLPMVFSGGGSGPLARITKDGKELSITWPGGPLPVPRLSGKSALYPDVLPGVDLRVTADVDAFSEVLVVKTRAAAANPAVRRVRFTTKTKGVTLRTDPRTGALVATSGSQVVFAGATPMMWDSRSTVAEKLDTRAAEHRRDRLPATLESGDSAAPGSQADQRRPMRTEVGKAGLTVVADSALLDDPSTVYPVTIDPSAGGGAFHWTMLWKEYGNSSYYDAGCVNCDTQEQTSGVIRVGFQNFSGVSTIRSFFQMDTRSVLGKQLLAARFSLTQSWSGGWCGGPSYPVWAYRTDPIYPGITWNSAWNMNYIDLMGNNNEKRFYNNGSCPQDRVEWEASAAAGWAIANWSDSATIALVAQEEWDRNSWRRYQLDPILSMDYNSYPGTPDNLRTASTPEETGAACVTGSSRPYVKTRTPTLKAHVTDPDGDLMTATASVQVWNSSLGVFVNAGSSQVTSQPDNSTARMLAPASLADGVYRWTAQTSDGRASSPVSGACEFQIDATPPAAPQTVSSTDYAADGSFHGSPGFTGAFSIVPGTGNSADIKSYVWALTPLTTPPTDGTRTVAAAPTTHTATILATPTVGGLNTLRVWTVDNAGNISALASPRTYQFLVGEPSSPVGSWTAGDPAGSTELSDDTGGGHAAAAVGVTLGVPGRVLEGPTAARFDGLTSRAATTGPVVSTATSFSIAAWVRPATTTGTMTAVSIDGQHTAAIRIGTSGTSWRVKQATADDTSGTGPSVSSGTVRANVWAYLVATYDAGPKTLTLYVNGAAVATAPGWTPWYATGPLSIGRARIADAPGEYFSGDISDVRAWNRVLLPTEISASATTLTGSWGLDANGFDDLGLHDVTPGPGVTWGADRFGTPSSAAMPANAPGSYLAASSPVIRTDQSFTLSVWAKLPSNTGTPTVLAVAGTRFAAACIYSQAGGTQWTFAMTSADQDNPTISITPWTTVSAGQWIHLVAVYDATSATARLYIGGTLRGTKTGVTGWAASSSLMIGSSVVNGAAINGFPGSIDDVRVYQGAMPADQVANL